MGYSTVLLETTQYNSIHAQAVDPSNLQALLNKTPTFMRDIARLSGCDLNDILARSGTTRRKGQLFAGRLAAFYD